MEVFLEISLIVGITVIVSALARVFKQPLIVGYLLSGIIVSPYFLNLASSTETIKLFSQIGIAFLLFIVGLSLSPKVIKEVGKVSLVTGLGQIVFTSLIGFLIARLLGFEIITSVYIAVALTFSSTIIIMKLLSDKKDVEKLYGKISIGFLLVQDLVVIILLVALSTFSGNSSISTLSLEKFIFALISIPLLILISLYILPSLSKFFAKSQEFLFLFSAGWGLCIASLFHFFGFSMEVGALIAGISLSVSPFHYEISSKMRPLRDFFIILFFILLGSQMVFGSIQELIVPAIIFSLFILIGNPLIVMVLMGILGYRKKTSLQAGFTVAQISEFSLILISLGVSLGHISKEILSLVTIVGIITISGSTYLILYSDKIYSIIGKYLSVFERKELKEKSKPVQSAPILLFGYNRIGYDLVQSFNKIKEKYLIIDYNPDTIINLKKEGIKCRYGDADDSEFLDEINFSKSRMVVSTIPNFQTNLSIVQKTRELNKDAIIICVSHNIEEANALYEAGASYIIMPHFLGGTQASRMIKEFGFNNKKFEKEKLDHLRHLKNKKDLGHEHPKPEKD